MAAILGVDVSNVGQGHIDWCRAGPAVAFGICKASEGSSFVDPSLRANLAGLKAAGKPRGVYHFLRGGTSGAVQCRHFLSAVGDPAGIVLAVDVEVGGAGSQVVSFLGEFQTMLPTRRCLVYSNRGLWHASGGPADISGSSVVGWHAGYIDGRYVPTHGSLAQEWAGAGPKVNASHFGGITAFPLIQFTDHATVPGITGGCDGNAWLGSLAELQSLAGPGVPAPTSTPDIATLRRHPVFFIVTPSNGIRVFVPRPAAGAGELLFSVETVTLSAPELGSARKAGTVYDLDAETAQTIARMTA